MKYVDPDGRSSGYVMNNDSVFCAGHAGMFVSNPNGGFSFFEVTGLSDEGNIGEAVKDHGNSQILSKNPLASSNIGLATLVGADTESGVVRRDFTSRTEMFDYFIEAGYDSYIQFNTSAEQDLTIFSSAMSMGADFGNYNLIGESCGIWASDILSTGGINNSKNSIKQGNTFSPDAGYAIGIAITELIQNNASNAIGDRLSTQNNVPIVEVIRIQDVIQ